MSIDQNIQSLAAAALPVVLSVTLVEAARGWRAYKQGDTTGASLGRLTFNPANHVDPWGTIAIPSVLYLLSSGSFLFAYAKPIPINYSAMRDPKWGLIRTEAEGLLAFALQTIAWMAIGLLLSGLNVNEQFLLKMVSAGILINSLLFAFILLPIPPMPAGKVAMAFLPYRHAQVLARVEPYGFWVVMGLSLIGILGPLWFRPIASTLLGLSNMILSPLRALFS